jgi:hypothetical protein
MPVKVLLAGPVQGKIDLLIKRVNSANEKAGPFQAVISVGEFFEDGDAGSDCPAWFEEILREAKKLPVPLYFVGGAGALLSYAGHGLGDGGQPAQQHMLPTVSRAESQASGSSPFACSDYTHTHQ